MTHVRTLLSVDQMLAYCIAGFLRVKLFMKHPCPDFQREIFHESSITLSAYHIILMRANTIIVFNNYRIVGFCHEDFNVASHGIRNIKIRHIFISYFIS